LLSQIGAVNWKERDDRQVALVEVEQLNSTLMFRIHELQDEIGGSISKI
jgi:hypothetical protein